MIVCDWSGTGNGRRSVTDVSRRGGGEGSCYSYWVMNDALMYGIKRSRTSGECIGEKFCENHTWFGDG